MKIVVIGVRGLIGSKVATKLSAQGHDVIDASRRSGVDSLTGEVLANAVAGADVLVDDRRFTIVQRSASDALLHNRNHESSLS